MSISLSDAAGRNRILNLFDLSDFPGAEVVRIRRYQVVVAFSGILVTITAHPENLIYEECWEDSRWRPFEIVSVFGTDPDKEWLGTDVKLSGRLSARGVQRVVRRHLKRVGPLELLAAIPIDEEPPGS